MTLTWSAPTQENGRRAAKTGSMGCLLPFGRNGCVGCVGCLLPLTVAVVTLLGLLGVRLEHSARAAVDTTRPERVAGRS